MESLSITAAAIRGAQAIGYALEDVIDVVQALEPEDFVKSETAHNPPNHRVWHDTYIIPYDDMDLYLKFAGETLVDIVLTSFKERIQMSDTRIHPETGQELRRDVRRQTVTFGSLSRVVDVPGWYPDGDGDALFDGADLHAANAAFKELRSEYGGHVKAVRKARGLTQEEAGHIIGGGPRAFQKYESGKTPPSDAAVGLIEVLDRHPEALATLRDVRAKLKAVQPSATDAKRNSDSEIVRRARGRKPTAKLAKARG